MIRAVIVANVLVSALLSPKGNEALILLAEYLAVLRRPHFGFLEREKARGDRA